jgi:hypothetical protein
MSLMICSTLLFPILVDEEYSEGVIDDGLGAPISGFADTEFVRAYRQKRSDHARAAEKGICRREMRSEQQ